MEKIKKTKNNAWNNDDSPYGTHTKLEFEFKSENL